MPRRISAVRFCSVTPGTGALTTKSITATSSGDASRQQEIRQGRGTKSRLGCRECKARRVKCDETFPVCLRCQRRGSTCQPTAPPQQWHVEVPWLSKSSCADPLSYLPSVNKRLLRLWLERASRIMAVDPDQNPLSFPILEQVQSSPALLRVVQSVSSAHESFFGEESLAECLSERGAALELINIELTLLPRPNVSSFLSIFMLGLSTAWTDRSMQDIGEEHLHGAYSVLTTLLQEESVNNNNPLQFALGCYLYWDMACSLFLESRHAALINTPLMFDALQCMRTNYHPLCGYSTEIFYLLANMGRYCRMVMQNGDHDYCLERTFEEQLFSWQPSGQHPHLSVLSEAFRRHGLILLYRTSGINACGQLDQIDTDTENEVLEDNAGCLDVTVSTDVIIREYAIDTIRSMMKTPITSSFLNLHAIPLLTAGAELADTEQDLREEVVRRFKALYSMNRVPGNLKALEVLREVWNLKDSGTNITWLEVVMRGGYKLFLG